MYKSFREHHLFEILKLFDAQNLPLDVFLSYYFRAHKAVGAKDRRFISDVIYGMIRWKGLLDHLATSPVDWQKRFAIFQKFNPKDYQQKEEILPHIRASFPEPLFDLLMQHYGIIEALSLCMESNQSAPVTLRVNTLKTTRDALITEWQDKYSFSPCTTSKDGIIFHQKANFFAMEEFKQGLFEVQDEGSQIVASLVEATSKDKVLDYCAGSGGKTLAFAPPMQNKGLIYLYDIRTRALEEAKKRLKRAGIQNAQILTPEKLKNCRSKIDTVLVDVPCSGSGTFRRNPDLKWKFDPNRYKDLIQEQRSIFEEALQYMRPDGKIIYATCSLLPQENEEQITYFQEKFNLILVKPPFSSLPKQGCMDGFFAAVLKKA